MIPRPYKAMHHLHLLELCRGEAFAQKHLGFKDTVSKRDLL